MKKDNNDNNKNTRRQEDLDAYYALFPYSASYNLNYLDQIDYPCKVFVYGTLKRNYGNNVILSRGDAEFVGEASINGYALYCLGGFPAIKDCDDLERTVHGEVYLVNSKNTMESLDFLEGYIHGAPTQGMYNRIKTNVNIIGYGQEECYAYLYNGQVDPDRFIEDGVWERGKVGARKIPYYNRINYTEGLK